MNRFCIAIIFTCLATLSAAGESAPVSAIVGATVVDLEGKSPLENAVIVVEGERIKAIGSAADTAVPAGAEVVDASGTWLIPGLMNMHVHYGLVLPGKMAAELAGETHDRDDVKGSEMFDLSGKNALVPGATGGIGFLECPTPVQLHQVCNRGG